MESIIIEKMRVKDATETAEMLALAFAENPNTKAILPDSINPKNLDKFADIMKIAKLKRKYSNVFVAKYEDKVVGAINFAYWPKCQPSFLEQLRMMPKFIFTLGKTLPKAIKVMSAWGKQDPKTAHCHIGPLGVLPGFQGKGIGSKLLKQCLKIADEDKISSYLETDASKNVPLYERHGFKTIKEVPIFDYNTWLMWREVSPKLSD
jgi:ribosomal protein S18 acetylase RimI-like enzyme